MTAAAWNERYPIGTRVDYFPVRGDDEFVRTKTRTQAWEIDVVSRDRRGEKKAVLVSVEGKAGGVLVDHVWPVVWPVVEVR